MAEQDEDDTTIVRQGKEAFLFAEMGRFARELHTRPLAKLVEDLEGLLDLPDGKFALVSLAVGKRMRESDVEKMALTAQLRTLLSLGNPKVRERATGLLNPKA